jgi:osmotically-inducible protein OsmY
MSGLQLAIATGVSCVLFSLGCANSASDETLRGSIQAGLYADQTTKPESITVTVKGSVVTLSGDVSTRGAAIEAMKIANGTVGVKSVLDQMTIQGAPAADQLPNAGTIPR